MPRSTFDATRLFSLALQDSSLIAVNAASLQKLTGYTGWVAQEIHAL
jgi:hypothetical protein